MNKTTTWCGLFVLAAAAGCPQDECASGFDCAAGETCVLSDTGNVCAPVGGDGDADGEPRVDLTVWFGEDMLPVVGGQIVASAGATLRAEMELTGPVRAESCRLYVAGVEIGAMDADAGLVFAAAEGLVRVSCESEANTTIIDDLELGLARIDSVTLEDEAYLVGESIEVTFTGARLGPCAIEGGNVAASTPAGGTGVLAANASPTATQPVTVSCEGPTGPVPDVTVDVPVWDLTAALSVSTTEVAFGTPLTVSWAVDGAEFCALTDDIHGQYLVPNLPNLGSTLNELVNFELTLPYSVRVVLLCRQGTTEKRSAPIELLSVPVFDALVVSHRDAGDGSLALQVAFATRGMFPDTCAVLVDDDEVYTEQFNNTGTPARGPFFQGLPLSLPDDALSRVNLRCHEGLTDVTSPPVFVYRGDVTTAPDPGQAGDVTLSGNLDLEPATTALPGAFSALVEVGGNVTLDGTALTDTFVAGAPPGLSFLYGDLLVSNNPSLGGLDLPALQMVSGAVRISLNPALTAADLSSLNEVGRDLYLLENAWTTLSLPALGHIGQDLYLDGTDGGGNYSDTLQSLSLPVLEAIDRDVYLQWRGSLATLDVPALETVGGNFEMSFAPALAITGPALSTIGGYFGTLFVNTAAMSFPVLVQSAGFILGLTEGDGTLRDLRDIFPCYDTVDPITPPDGETAFDFTVGSNQDIDCASVVAFACGLADLPGTLGIQQNGGACPDAIDETNIDCTITAPPVCEGAP